MGATMQEEMVSAMNLLVDAYEELKKLSPEHELLRFVKEISPSAVKFTEDEELSKEFSERFPPKNRNSGFEHPIYGFIYYTKAMEEARIVEYFKNKGLEIDVRGWLVGKSMVIDFSIDGLDFKESLLATGFASFAVIPVGQFERLEKAGMIIDVDAGKSLTDPQSGNLISAKIGRADVEIKGITGSKVYQGVNIVGIEFNPPYKWGAVLGREFIFSFDYTEMGWPGDPVVGFYGCRKISSD